jgi:hypothetical protein
MVAVNRMRFGGYEFAIEAASFRYITQSWSGPGWDFNFSGPCVSGPDVSVFCYGARLLTEAAPLPLGKAADYTGVELDLPGSFDEESGEPFFGNFSITGGKVSGHVSCIVPQVFGRS